MNINRRNFLIGTGSAVGALMAVPYISHAQSKPIRLGMLLDTSGPFSAYGIPMERHLNWLWNRSTRVEDCWEEK